jgi:Septum formation
MADPRPTRSEEPTYWTAPPFRSSQPAPWPQAPAPKRTNSVLVAGVAGVVGLLVGLASGVGLMAAVQEARDRASGPSPDSETSRDGQRRESVSVFDLEAGDCILQLSVGEIRTLDLVDCDEPHDAEVFGTVELEQARDAPYPGDEETINRVNDLCTRLFEDYVGEPPSESELTIDGIYPVEESWRFGDREGVCYAFHDEGPLTDSIEGSGR